MAENNTGSNVYEDSQIQVLEGLEAVKMCIRDRSISKRYNISVEDIKGKKRTNEIALPRHIAIYVIRRVTNISLQNTAKIFGRDHTTILASVDVIKNKMAEDSSFEYEINSICNEFM